MNQAIVRHLGAYFTQGSKMLLLLTIAAFISGALAAQSSGPGPHFVGDSPQARSLYYLADKDHDDLLTRPEFHSVFLAFDHDNDTRVTLTEFITEWKAQNYGPDSEGIRLFMNLDANRDAYLTEAIDMPYIFHFFDRNGDQHVTEGEFVVQWVKISI